MTTAVVVEQLGHQVDNHDRLAVGDTFEPRAQPREKGNVALGRGRRDGDVASFRLEPALVEHVFSFASCASA
jgi:hypothetical protein